MVLAWNRGAKVAAGIDHPHCQVEPTALADNVHACLAQDFETQTTH